MLVYAVYVTHFLFSVAEKANMTGNLSLNFSGLVIDQAVKGGFRFRNVEEEEVLRIAMLSASDGTVMLESARKPLSVEKSTKSVRSDESERDVDSGSMDKHGSMEKDYQPPQLIEEVK